MMASFKVHSGATAARSFVHRNRAFVRPESYPVCLNLNLNPNPISKKNQIQRVFASHSSPPCDRRVVRRDPRPIAVQEGEEAGGGNKIVAEKLDRWMRGSVEEIVKNLKKAPLLVQVYSDGGDGEEKAKIRAERAVVEEWPAVKGEWESGERRSPDGLIFVEELRDGENGENGEDGEDEETVTRAWGIVVQGRGVECGPVCYLLKTSKVGAGIGMGLFCTHFCLVRVKSFRESAFCQFKNCWLLQ